MDATAEFYSLQVKDTPAALEEIRALLAANDLALDEQVETFVVCRQQGRLVACAGLDHATIKCVAVAAQCRGEALSLKLGSEVVALAAERGRFHLFLYSAPHNLQFFRGWGFYPLVEVPDLVMVMENSPVAIRRYCEGLARLRRAGGKIGSIVMNANPFTLGHRHLVEQAAAACDWLHVFVVGENASLVSYDDRFALVAAGVGDIANLTLHPGSDYIISRATFPGYFLKETKIIEHGWAAIDLLLFRRYIAPALGITHRYVGSEPLDVVTNRYNQDMRHWLQQAESPAAAISVVELPRLTTGGRPISATEVRERLARRDFATLRELVPTTTLQFLESKFADAVQTAP